MDNTNKFTGKSENYVKARPDYPGELFKYLKSEFFIDSSTVFADIGAGTGIFTKKLLNLGCKVFAVEPNADMRNALEKNLGDNKNLNIINGTDKDTRLSAGSVDFISAAQAFHWFDKESFKKECKRILKPNGYVILIWNTRKSNSELVKENAQICRKYCPDFTGFSGGIRNSEEKIISFFDNGCKLLKFKNDLVYTKEKFIKRMLSSSYSLTENHENYNEYINKLSDFFSKYENSDGLLYLPNETLLYVGKIV